MKKTLFFYLCILCWLVVPNLGYGQISIASSSSAVMSNSSNFSMVYSSASGTNQVLLVGVSAQHPYLQMNSITYGGFALTKLISVMNTGQTRVEIWYLLNPPSGSSQLILNNSSNDNAVIGVTTFNNVSQASPFDTSVTNLGNGSIASLNVPSATGDLVFAVTAFQGGSGHTPGSEQVELYDSQSVSSVSGSAVTKTGSSNVSISTTSSGGAWSIAGVSLNPFTSVQNPTPDSSQYIYVHQKSIDESTSQNVTYAVTGPDGYSKTFTLNDLDTSIRIQDISADSKGSLYAIAYNGHTNYWGLNETYSAGQMYVRNFDSSSWSAVSGVSAKGVAGGPYNYNNNGLSGFFYISDNGRNVLYREGSNTCTIYSGSSDNEVIDIAWTPYGGNRGSVYISRGTRGGAGTILRYSNNGNVCGWSSNLTINNVYKSNHLAAAVDGTLYYSAVDSPMATITNLYRRTISGSTTNLGRPGSANPNLNNNNDGEDIKSIVVNGKGEVLIAFRNLFTYEYDGGWQPADMKSRGVIRLGSNPASLEGQVWGIPQFWNPNYTDFRDIWTRATDGDEIWWIDDERVRTSPNSQGILLPVPTPGVYTVTVTTLPSNYTVTEINLFDPTSNSTKNIGAKTAQINVASHEMVHAEFVIWNEVSDEFDGSCADGYKEDFGTGNDNNALIGQTSYHHKNGLNPISVETAEDGYYKVVNKTSLFALPNSGDNLQIWDGDYNDHTSGDGTGRMMVVNAGYNKEEFFRKKITNLTMGAYYSFTAWFMNISSGTNNIKPNVTFNIWDVNTGSLLNTISTGDISNSGVWQEFGFNFFASTSDIYITIVNNTIGGDGNDLAIDDIEFKMALPGESFEYELGYTYCDSVNLEITNPISENLVYSIDNWVHSQSSTTFSNLESGTYTVRAKWVGYDDCEINVTININPMICGNVFNDINGLTDDTVNEGAEPNTLPIPLYINVLDASNNVVKSIAVNTDGTYSGDLPTGNYTLQLSTNEGVEDQPAPTQALPAEWVNTGENIGFGAGDDGTVNGTIALNLTSSTSDIHFGIQHLPTPGSGENDMPYNPGIGNTIMVPIDSFTNISVSSDVHGGNVTSIRITEYPGNASSIIIDGVTYTSSNWPTEGVIVSTDSNGVPTVEISVAPNFEGEGSVILDFVSIDNAGFESSTTGTAVLNFPEISCEPDLTPSLAINPAQVIGNNQAQQARIVVSEILGCNTNGSDIYVMLPRSTHYVLQPYDSSKTTSVGGLPVLNSDWEYTGMFDDIHYWHYIGNGGIINGYDITAFGIDLIYSANSAAGNEFLTATIVYGSGGEVNTENNFDTEEVRYGYNN